MKGVTLIFHTSNCETMFMIVTQHMGFRDTKMLNETVSVRVPKRLKEKIDQAVQKGLYTNRSDFVRNAIREKLTEKGEN